MNHFPDEEPDTDEGEYDYWKEEETASNYCERCGIKGHKGKDCPTATSDLLKKLIDRISLALIAIAILLITMWLT